MKTYLQSSCKLRAGSILMLSLFAASGLPSAAAAGEKIHLVTESYMPFNYADNGKLTGFAVEIVEAFMADAGIDYDMELLPWARAIALAENNPDYCVFTTVHTEERDQRFRWVEPLFTSYNYLTKMEGSDVNAKTIPEATKYLVGTQLGDYTVGVLKSKGFERIDITSEIDLTLNKLTKGRIDLMPMADGMIREKREQGIMVEPMLVLVEVMNSVACNINMSPDLVAKMQASLAKVIADGTRQRIFDKYGFAEGGLK